jgi:tetratricopeptide (TPR) repeat protein
MYPDVVASLRLRFAMWEGGDAAAVLAQQAVTDLRFLLESRRDPVLARSAELRAEALEIAARLHWYRYLSLENADLPCEADWQLVMHFIGELADHAPAAAEDISAAVTGRLADRFWAYLRNRDPEILLAQSTAAEVICLDKLNWAKPDGENLSEARYVLAYVHWRRYLAGEPEDGEADLRLALSEFKSIYDPLHSVIPPLVREYLNRLLSPLGTAPPGLRSDWYDTMIAKPENREICARRVLRSRRAMALVPGGGPEYAAAGTELCASLLHAYAAGLDSRDLDEIAAWAADLLLHADAASDEVLARLAEAVSQALTFRGSARGDDADNAAARDILYHAIERLGAGNPVVRDVVAALVRVLLLQSATAVGADECDRAIATIRAYGLAQAGDESGQLRFYEMLLLRARYQRSRDPEDLNAAISIGREVLEAVPPNSEEGLLRRFTLAEVLHDRFRGTGSIEDLGEAIVQMRRTIRWRGNDKFPLDLDYLSSWLLERYQLLGMPEDLDQASTALWRLTRDHGPGSQARLSNALVASLRGGKSSGEDILRQLVDGLKDLLRMPDDPVLPLGVKLVNLSSALRALAELTGSAEDADESVACARAAVGAIPYLDPRRLDAMENLVLALLSRGKGPDFDHAVGYASLAAGRADDPAKRAGWQLRLGGLYYDRYQKDGRQADVTEAIAMFREAARAPELDTGERRNAALGWGQEEALLGNFDSAADGFSLALGLIPDVAWTTGSLSARRKRLGTWARAARLGAASALRAGRPGTAVELLERGRGILSGEIVWRRSQVEMVRAARPDLAEQLAAVLEALEGVDKTEGAEKFDDYMRSTMATMKPLFEEREHSYIEHDSRFFLGKDGYGNIKTWSSMMFDEVVDNPHERRLFLTRQWERIMAEIRCDPGLEYVGQPTSFAELVSAAPDGAIVIVNFSSIGSDAVIVRNGDVSSIELPGLTAKESSEQARKFLQEIVRIEFGEEPEDSPERLREAIRSTQEWLWDAVAAPVLDALGHSEPPGADKPWPRVWWCLTSFLGLLPMHAAGRAGTSAGSGFVIDRVISSYTSTLTALLRARARSAQQPGSGPRMLAVGMPETPGAAPLRGVARELASIAELVPQARPPLIGADATVDAVVSALPESTWLHIACHGTPAVPEKMPAQLYLADGPLSVNRIGWQWVRGAELAYLSACHTAAAIFQDPDEVDHLAAAFQSAGFRHVIGTLWGADDLAARQVAREFYRGMDLSSPSADNAAEALHRAVRSLRDRHPDEPHLWAPFVHYGP